MKNKYSVRIMRSAIKNLKNVGFGEITYMNYGSINSRGVIDKKDIVGLYGQNGSGKTALVEALDILKNVIRGVAVPFDVYAGILSRENPTVITTDFFIARDKKKYKATYEAYLRANDDLKKIEIFKEKLTYWTRGSTWKAERDITFENPYYEDMDLLSQQKLSIESEHKSSFEDIPFLLSIQNLALISAQNYRSVLFNSNVLKGIRELKETDETIAFRDVIIGIMQFGTVDLNVVKVQQLGTINCNQMIPVNVHRETEMAITQEVISLDIAGVWEFDAAYFEQVKATIEAINIAIRSIVPNLQIELKKRMELEQPDGTKKVQVDVYSNRNGKKFLIRYESEGIKRIISILNYLISVYNNEGVCLVVDELDSGIFEFLLGELLGMMSKEMKGQLIFTSHNLRILEMLDSKNIICSTTNPYNRYIRLVGIEKNHNKRDFYIRAITLGGQKEELYDEDDLIAMGYAFRKAGKVNNDVKLLFSSEFERKLQTAERQE
ncbi:AAA family ATPase [Oribacterium sp. P9]|uniref:AAA family ATPase n=1 Tax=Oribacterium sp. P9 TaxID=3378068 RepID=UPI003967B6C9